MRIVERFGDWVLSWPVVELASERQEKMIRIQGLSSPLNDHLFKLYVMPGSRCREHWVGEVDEFLSTIDNTTWGNRKRYRADDYSHWLTDSYFRRGDPYAEKVIRRRFEKILSKYEGEPRIRWSVPEFEAMADRFYSYLGPVLARERGAAYGGIDVSEAISGYFGVT